MGRLREAVVPSVMMVPSQPALMGQHLSRMVTRALPPVQMVRDPPPVQMAPLLHGRAMVKEEEEAVVPSVMMVPSQPALMGRRLSRMVTRALLPVPMVRDLPPVQMAPLLREVADVAEQSVCAVTGQLLAAPADRYVGTGRGGSVTWLKTADCADSALMDCNWRY